MDEKRRESLEQRLLQERREALEALNEFDDRARNAPGEEDGDLTNYPLHMADEGTDTMQQEKEFLLASKEGRRLYAIDEALRRIYKRPDEVGQCVECGREIADERLELIPWTTTCVEHAEQDANTGQPG